MFFIDSQPCLQINDLALYVRSLCKMDGKSQIANC